MKRSFSSITKEPHDELLEWATGRGVKLNGITPKRIPGRGIGLVATRVIKSEEVVLEVPTQCIRTISTVPKALKQKLPSTLSVHGLLAADLALDTSETYTPWNAVCPRPEDFTTAPLLWPPELQALLPPPARDLLFKQQTKFARDWAAVAAAFPDLGEDDYRYAWLLVNTRTFYYLNPQLKRRGKEDHMCLQPVADLFNHGAEGCNVAFDHAGFAIKALQPYDAGEEVKICYGRHGCDFLLAEYGFVMEGNRWDEVGLDDIVVPRLSERQREMSEEADFLGKYVLDRDTVCYRTQVALRLLCCGSRQWRRFLDGVDDGESSQAAVDELLGKMLKQYQVDIEGKMQEIEELKVGETAQKEILLARWKQIQELLEAQTSRLDGTPGE
ncbi:SET domain-containing protein [Xylariaceae sp. FL0016]|nr:SET domain-containing protein [Xylariaceae sp. FL0016]